jgi:predicted kinase
MSYYVVVRGPLAVGKTTVCERLAGVLRADHISIDRILEEYGLEEWDEDRISLRSFLRANAIAADQARRSFERGSPVLFDGCFYWRQQIHDLVERVHAPHYVFRLKAPLAVCIARDRTRPRTPTGATPKGGDQLGEEAARDVYRLVSQVRSGVPIDASGPVEATVNAILVHLPKLPPGRVVR